jgi:hypothetical protein
MNTICRKLIEHPGAWTARTITKEQVILDLGERALTAIDALLQKTRHLKPQEVAKEEFNDPAVAELMAGVRDVLMNGRGLLILRGVTPQRYSEEEFQRIYWGLGIHLGNPAVQSVLGDRLGYVESKEGDPVNRGYRGLGELSMHTDSYEIVGLMCVRKAVSGGESALVSSLAIHNEILKNRPDLLDALYEGYYHSSEEARATDTPVTDRKIPIYSCVGDIVSCTVSAAHIRAAATVLNVPLPQELAEALDYFILQSKREDLGLRFMLEPGEILIWNNYTNLHSRTAFTQSSAMKRLLLRLWLTVPNGRPVDPAIRIRAETYERLYRNARGV